MLSKVFSAGLVGIDAFLVEGEVDIAFGLATWSTVGLPESTVRESRERVIGAVRNSGYHFEKQKITINLAPANVKKGGTAFDLPIAIGLLASSGLIPREALVDYLIVGELSLRGEVKPVPGILPIALFAKNTQLKKLILPVANLPEAAVTRDVTLLGVQSLSELVQHFTGERPLRPPAIHPSFPPAGTSSSSTLHDFSDIKGQPQAKRALEVAAAGGHNLLLMGPPGSGKTMLAQRFPTILPDMTFEEALETTKIYSVVGLLNGQGPLIHQRPFRSPHHTISAPGLAGGGTVPRPGEISLAHHGVLFLDEFSEFRKDVLEVLRQPLESGKVTIARSLSTLTFPANFTLVASTNPCPCGFRGSQGQDCYCTVRQLQNYRSRLSGPLLDRIDIQLEVPRLKYQELIDRGEGENSSKIRSRVLKARQIQTARFQGSKMSTNSQMSGRLLKKFCVIDSQGARLLEQAVEKLSLSARAYDRILRVARTIADLAALESVQSEHLAEAIHYRSLDRNSKL